MQILRHCEGVHFKESCRSAALLEASSFTGIFKECGKNVSCQLYIFKLVRQHLLVSAFKRRLCKIIQSSSIIPFINISILMYNDYTEQNELCIWLTHWVPVLPSYRNHFNFLKHLIIKKLNNILKLNYICCTNQLTGFYMRAALTLNGLIDHV